MPARIETTWDQIPVNAKRECAQGHQRTPLNTFVYTTPEGLTELRCRVCARITAAKRRERIRKNATTNRGER